MIITRHQFVDALIATVDKVAAGDVDPEQFSTYLRKEFLKRASETPDNLEATERIEFGKVENRSAGPPAVFGLKVVGKNTLLSDILWRLECDEGIDLIIAKRPELTREEAAAALRMFTVVFNSLQASVLDLDEGAQEA